MGSSSSKNKAAADPRCPHCAFSIATPTVAGAYLICARCHGQVQDPKATQPVAPAATPAARSSVLNPLASRRSGYDMVEHKDDSSSSSSSSSSSALPPLPLDRIECVPFFETLPVEHQPIAASINYEQEMLQLYLTEFFAAQAAKVNTPEALIIEVGTRFQIKSVDWKVRARSRIQMLSATSEPAVSTTTLIRMLRKRTMFSNS